MLTLLLFKNFHHQLQFYYILIFFREKNFTPFISQNAFINFKNRN
jgi:hypothetical protein